MDAWMVVVVVVVVGATSPLTHLKICSPLAVRIGVQPKLQARQQRRDCSVCGC